jgi:uncharacterized protein
MRRWLHVSLALVVGVAFGACSGDDDDDSSQAGASLGEASEQLDSAGDAAAAEGADLDERPGPEERQAWEDFGEVAIAVVNADGEVQGFCVLTAENDDERGLGLMNVTDLNGYAGMLFVWDADNDSGFWMRNTVLPLSIAWFDADGALVSTADMEPCPDSAPDCPTYPPEGPYRFALEVPQGRLEEMGITEDSTLRVGGPCAARSGSV